MVDQARTQEQDGEQSAWMLRALLVLQAPRPIFAALRDDSPGAASARSEPLLLLAILGGMGALLLTPDASTILDSSDFDGIVFATWLFIVGGVLGTVVMWGVGALLYGTASWLGSLGSYRRARHVVGFALAPLALSFLVMLPIRLVVFGADTFKLGGSDNGGLGLAVALLGWAFAAWSLALLVVGVRAVHAWTWPRSLATVGVVVAALAVLTALRLVS